MLYRSPLGAGAGLCVVMLFVVGARGLRNQAGPANANGPDSAKFPRLFLRDVVVSNTDQSLKATDQFFNSEPGIAVNPTDARKLVISSFSGAWSATAHHAFKNAPVWYSTSGGDVWTKEFTIPAPPGVPSYAVMESPCDETFDYGRDGTLYGTFLLNGIGEEGGNCSSSDEDEAESRATFAEVYTGGTANPADARAWQWHVIGGKTQPTNRLGPDQPWVAVNKDPNNRRKENVYVAYQGPDSMQVAVAGATLPLNFEIDHESGTKIPFRGNPGHRIAGDYRSGAVYSLYEQGAALDCPADSGVSYMLNPSTDGGITWELNGSAAGVPAAEVCSYQDLFFYLFGQPEPNSFGGVNPLRGGVDALAVDSKTGAVYVVFGEYDKDVNRDRLSIVRVTNNGRGGVDIGHRHFVSGPEHEAALPGVAVAENGNVGVLYDTADGLDENTSKPYFSVHFAVSRDEGTTFQDTVAQTFLTPANSPGGTFGPRPLGDYQQLKSLGNTFYGVFSGDGEPFGRPFHKIDPIFLKTSSGK